MHGGLFSVREEREIRRLTGALLDSQPKLAARPESVAAAGGGRLEWHQRDPHTQLSEQTG